MIRMWWFTGSSQLKVFGMNHRIMNLPTVVQEEDRKGMLSPFWEECKRREEEQRSGLCAINGFFTVVLADSSVPART